MKSVEKAFISGEMPVRIREKITIGRVVDPAPEVKLAITTSSNDKIKASSHADSMAGEIIGRVIDKRTLDGFAPRSKAASSSVLSK